MRRTLNRHQNEKGYVIIMALVAVSLVSLVSFTITDNMTTMMSRQRMGVTSDTVEKIRKDILASIYNNEVWRNQTAASNNCQSQGENCSPNSQAVLFDLKDASGTIINGSSSASSGYTSRGVRCSAFNSTYGNDACPIRYQLTWQPVNCRGTSCDVQVTGRLFYVPADQAHRYTLRTSTYDFQIIRGRESGSLQEACFSIGGTFDQVRNFCELRNRIISCPAGQFIVRATSTGQPSCRPILGYGAICAPGQAAVGIRADGSIDCRSSQDWVL